ncbi:MAG: carboxymuconolactone decarboxylase family protein [Parvularculaceae bacterium]
MAQFDIHDLANTDGERKETLEAVKANYGFVPNLLGGLAEAPAAARAYMAIGGEVMKTSFSPTERHVAWFAVNFYNDCHYCMPAHTAIAKSEGVADDIIEAARTGAPYADARLEALRAFAIKLVDRRGVVADADADAFLEAGFTKQQALEAVLIVTHKTLSNYANHLMKTPVDEPFSAFAWTKPEAA